MSRHATRGATRLGLSAILVTILVAGCGLFNPKEKNDPVVPPTGDRKTPEHLIQYFAQYQTDPNKNVEEYARCLHPAYGFFFLPSDIPETGESFWTKDVDVQATGDLFDAAMSMSVTLSMEDTLGTEVCDPGPPEVVCTSYSVLVDMSVTAISPETQQVTTFLVNGRATFVITRDPAADSLYVIREIHDETGQARPLAASARPIAMAQPGSEEVSWGRLREMLAPQR